MAGWLLFVSVAVWPSMAKPACCRIQQILHSHTHLSVRHLGSTLSLRPLWSVVRSNILLIARVSVKAQRRPRQIPIYLLVWTLLWGLKHLAASLWQANCWLIYVICASRQIDSRLAKGHFFTDDNRAIYLLSLIFFLRIVCHNKLCSQLTSLRRSRQFQAADNMLLLPF